MNVRVRKAETTPLEDTTKGQREKAEPRRKLRSNSQRQEENPEDLDPHRMERTFRGIRVVVQEPQRSEGPDWNGST